MIREILQMGDPRLRELALPVSFPLSAADQALLEDMTDSCSAANGAGIAAPQLGVLKAVFLASSKPTERYPNAPEMEPRFIFNPRVVAQSESTFSDWEGCLSVPGFRAKVARPKWVDVEFQDQAGRRVACRYEGFLAKLFTHELDHLQGRLFVDHLPVSERP